MYFIFCILLVTSVSHAIIDDKPTLQQVHVIFRHGDRTPDVFNSYVNDPFINETYYPMGHGELTLLGKRQEYTIGLKLRKEYNKFLGNIYTPDIMEARTTDFSRTKMSLELVMAGLWPPIPTQQWNPFLIWQPIPYNYGPLMTEKIIRFPYACQKLLDQYEKLFELNEIKVLLEPYQWIFELVTKYAGINDTKPYNMMGLYFTLLTQKNLGLKIPDWTHMIFPYALEEIVLLEYNLQTYTKDMLRLAAGGLFYKIRSEVSDKINEINTKKIYLYSAHEINIAFTLKALNILYPHVPNYGSYIIFELHKIGKKYSVKIFYTDYSQDIPTQLILPGCEIYCPWETFLSLTEDVTDANLDC